MDETEIIGLIITLFQVVVPCLGVSIAYYIAGSDKPATVRVLKSSHGLIFVIAYSYAMIAHKFTAMGEYGHC